MGGENWAEKSAPLKPWPPSVLISMDQYSNIWLTGRCPLEFEDIQIEDQGIFLLKLDSLGNFISSSLIRDGNDVFDLFVDQSHFIYVAGSFSDAIIINEETFSGFNDNYFISKFDNNLNLLWTYIIKRKTKFIGSTGNISVNTVKIFPNPAQNYITAEIKDNSRTQGYVHIYSITGEIVMQSEIEIDKDKIDITGDRYNFIFFSNNLKSLRLQ